VKSRPASTATKPRTNRLRSRVWDREILGPDVARDSTGRAVCTIFVLAHWFPLALA
jgi:hypothetical protein